MMTPARHRRRETGPTQVRPFRDGDDEGWIDWGITARSGRIMVRAPIGDPPARAAKPTAPQDPGTIAGQVAVAGLTVFTIIATAAWLLAATWR